MLTPGGDLDQFLGALRRSHGFVTRVTPYYGGVPGPPVPLASGEISVAAGQRSRRTMTATVDPRLVPRQPGDPTSPFGTEWRVEWGLVQDQRTGPDQWVDVFYGRVVTADDLSPGGEVRVELADNAARVVEGRFLSPESSRDGYSVGAEISRLIGDIDPGATVTFDDRLSPQVPVGYHLWFPDRDQAVDDICAAIGATWHARPTGPTGSYHVAPVPSTDGDLIPWEINDGADGVVVSTARRQSREMTYSAVVVEGQGPNNEPVRGVAIDDDPSSPTFYFGPFGRKPRHVNSPSVTTTEQARDAALRFLAESRSMVWSRSISCPPMPLLDVDDVVVVRVNGGYEVHVVDAIRSLPLVAPPGSGLSSMTIETRSLRAG